MVVVRHNRGCTNYSFFVFPFPEPKVPFSKSNLPLLDQRLRLKGQSRNIFEEESLVVSENYMQVEEEGWCLWVRIHAKTFNVPVNTYTKLNHIYIRL